MNKSPFLLEQIIKISGFDTQFITNTNITNKQLLIFYKDISKIIIELDKEINYEGDIFKWKDEFHLKDILNPLQFSRIEKSLQVKKNLKKKFNINDVVRAHNITYYRNPKMPSEEIQKMNKNNQYKEVLMVNPNIIISSTNPIYNIDDLFNKIKGLPYVRISEKYNGVFDINEIINSSKMLLENPPKININ